MYLVYQGDSVELPLGETVLGRDIGCALRFNDPAVSRQHVRIVRRRDQAFVEDLGSTNGTLVNGELAAVAVEIEDGDVIVVGSRELTVLTVSTPGAEPPTVELDQLSPPSETKLQRLATKQIRIPDAARSANQRCPRCGIPVSSEDDSCRGCQYEWGSFRVRSPTVPTANALSRRDARHVVELHVVYVSSELEIEATTRDLSVGGVFICSQVLDPVGTTCQLTILADGRPPLRIDGVVRRVVAHEQAGGVPVGIGVEFASVGDAERAWLEDVVERMGRPELP